jgi:aminopeptidase N
MPIVLIQRKGWAPAQCKSRLALFLLVPLLLASCGDGARVSAVKAKQQSAAIEAGVSEQLARTRADRLAAIEYHLRFDIPSDPLAPVQARAEIGFDLADNAAPLLLDFRGDPSDISALRINDAPAGVELVNEHIVLPVSGLRRGRNRVAVEFRAGDGALNRNPDFIYTLFVPDRARTVFPLFDQPDLKARFELTLVVPAGWEALANAPLAQRDELGAGRVEYRFAPSDPISSYVFSFVAGKFQVVTRELNGRAMTMLHRETDAAKVARNVDAIFDLHAQSIAWLETYTGIAYPFSKFDFVLLPGFPYGGMEHVGAIQYRAPSLLLDPEPPLTDLLRRAQLIAHETAHMWFGNLVTMRWFDDVWTKEVFANFMAGKMVDPGFPEVDHGLNFLVNHYPAAYAVDRSEGANPIRQALPNLNQAGQLYGSIIYHKAPIMMRQLELLLGEEALRQGLGAYLRKYAWGNATWPDLIAILDARTDIDLAGWSAVWVNTAGRPQFRLESAVMSGSGAAGGSRQNLLLQEDPAGLGRTWPQRFDLLELYPHSQSGATVTADTARTVLPPFAGEVPAAILFNADGRGYGLFPAGIDLLQSWDRLQPVQRGAALIAAWDNLLAGSIGDIATYFDLLLDIVQRERDPLLLELALGQLQYVYQCLLDDARQTALAPAVEEGLWATVMAQADGSSTKLVFRYYAALVASPARLQHLYAIWAGTLAVDQLVLEEEDLIDLAQSLAIRLPARSGEIVVRQLANTANPDSRRRLEFIAPSLSPEEAVRDAFFESLRNPENRQTESWVSEAVANLHHPSRITQSEKYILPSLELLQEIQVTGDIFFPVDWLRATLGNHNSATAAQIVRRFLAERPDYSPQLRMKILQEADMLFRAAQIRNRSSVSAPASPPVR